MAVDICRENPTGCLEICIASNAWDEPKGRATLFRHIVAVMDGAATFEDIENYFPDGIRAGTTKKLVGVTIITEKLFQINGTTY